MLGPLYHLLTLSERESAVAEAARLLKPNGVLLAAACNRMMALATDFYSEPERGADTLTANHRLVVDGILNPDLAPTIGHSYFTNVRDFRSLFEKAFDELLLVGVESFAGNHQGLFLGLSRAAQDAWLDLDRGYRCPARSDGPVRTLPVRWPPLRVRAPPTIC